MSSVQTVFAVMKFIEDFFLLSISYKDIFSSIAEIAFFVTVCPASILPASQLASGSLHSLCPTCSGDRG